MRDAARARSRRRATALVGGRASRRSDAAIDAEVLAPARRSAGTAPTLLDARPRSATPPGLRRPRYRDARSRAALSREPVAHIIGHREFWGLRLRGHAGRPHPASRDRADRRGGARLRARAPVPNASSTSAPAAAASRWRSRANCPTARVVADRHLDGGARRRARNAAPPWRRRAHQLRATATCSTASTATVDLIVSNPPYVPAGDEPAPAAGVVPLRAARGAVRRRRRPARSSAGSSTRRPAVLAPGGRLDRGIRLRPGSEPFVTLRRPRAAGRSIASARPAGHPAHRVIHVRDAREHDGRLPVLQDHRGRDPGAIVYQDDRVVAFKDINPQAPMHVLVVPRRHIATLNDLTPDDDGAGRRDDAARRRDREGARARRPRLPHGVQLQRRRRADGVPHPPARARRTAARHGRPG